MFIASICILSTLLFLPLALLPLALNTWFTQEELNDMGVCYEIPGAGAQSPAAQPTTRQDAWDRTASAAI